MMMSDIENLEDIVKQKMFVLDGTAHSYSHVNRTLKIATFLAKKEQADVELVQAAALLHDIGRTVGEPHNETGAKLAHEILKRSTNYSQEKIEKIVKIVLQHSIAFRDRLETLEERIVWDADKIDLLGVIGIARLFHWLGRKPFETVVETYFEELKPIYPLLNTSTAKRVARKRYERTMACLSALEKEFSAADLETG
jgi:uncharacterized protein